MSSSTSQMPIFLDFVNLMNLKLYGKIKWKRKRSRRGKRRER